MHGGAGDRRVGQRAGAGILHPVTVNGVTGDDTVSDVATDIYTVTVAGSITGDGAVAAVGQVAADIHTTTVSTVTAHGGVGQGAVAADVHTGTVTGGAAGDDTVSDIATDVHTV
ncbi:hypothetical protein, partial [Escherichia coli]|uniref:hypothetical protein n=1 Tax=Escherichia coli TaxID=562 RepID=UPI001A91C755